jgi:hypothetical protein
MQPTAAKVLTRVSMVVAILAAVSAGALNVTVLRQRITDLQSNLKAQTAAREKAETEVDRSKGEVARTTAALTAAKLEKEQALATAAAESRRAERLNQDLTTVRQERNDAQAEVARYKGAGMEPEQILYVAKDLKDLRKALADAQEQTRNLQAKVKLLAGREAGDLKIMPAGLKAKVIALDPKWRFIVLDAGEDQGVIERGELLISREGKLIAKAEVSRVQENRSVANLKPGWELAQVMEGDTAIPEPLHR